MAIQPIQLNIEQNQPSQKKAHTPYRQAEGTIATENLVKPLPPKGHLIHDNIGNSVKYFFEDIAYDMKSVKNGFNGTANDHQLGRLNDVGLKLGGVGIAAYLASRTTNPKARLMEYVGLITFLTSMSLYPKIAINAPAKIINGFDIDKQYIDDQGRKKSVMQDGNYVPFDMYLGKLKEEDLDAIGDSMGVPRNIKNRHDVVKEQMRKVSVQNNTLWMLTAGLATPLMTALACCGFEQLIGKGMEASRNKNYNTEIENLLKITSEMSIDEVKDNTFSKDVARLLSGYKGKEVPENEFKTLLTMLTDQLDNNTSEGIKADLEKLLRKGSDGKDLFVLNSDSGDDIIAAIKNVIPKKQAQTLEQAILPTKSEVETAIKQVVKDADFADSKAVSSENLVKIREALNNVLKEKFSKVEGLSKEGLEALRHDALDNIMKTLSSKKTLFMDESAFNDIVSLSKIISEFKDNQKALDKCKSFKFEQAPETVLARYYGKFENAFLKELGISFGDLRKMRDSSSYTQELLDKKMTELCKDEARYTKTMERLSKIISEMEVALNGSNPDESYVQKLINGIENNYNNTARRLDFIGKFNKTVDRLVKEDVSNLGHSVTSRNGVFDLLDGVIPNTAGSIAERAKGLGSSKNLEISRIIDRYSGARNSFYRVLHTLDFYKRANASGEFSSIPELAEKLSKMGKEVLLSATTSDHTLKLDTVNAQKFYKDFMNNTYKIEEFNGTKSKGFVTDAAKDALKGVSGSENGSVLERFQYYIARFKNLMTNYNVDFTKSSHIEDEKALKQYAQSARTRMSMFNLVAQSPVDMAKGAAGRRYGNMKWLRIVGGLTSAVFGVTILAQFGFGRISNPHTLKKQVKNETDK